jgi:hypothetical protein
MSLQDQLRAKLANKKEAPKELVESPPISQPKKDVALDLQEQLRQKLKARQNNSENRNLENLEKPKSARENEGTKDGPLTPSGNCN